VSDLRQSLATLASVDCISVRSPSSLLRGGCGYSWWPIVWLRRLRPMCLHLVADSETSLGNRLPFQVSRLCRLRSRSFGFEPWQKRVSLVVSVCGCLLDLCGKVFPVFAMRDCLQRAEPCLLVEVAVDRLPGLLRNECSESGEGSVW
jgi:hypothetical protein